jgi:hypothetical protein
MEKDVHVVVVKQFHHQYCIRSDQTSYFLVKFVVSEMIIINRELYTVGIY